MHGLRVRGLACPFNVENDYDETMRPHAFDAFLEEHGGIQGIDGHIEADNVDLPMHLMHGHPVGTWEKLWTTPEGLWAEGIIENAVAITAFKNGTRELSISYSLSGEQGISAKRVNSLGIPAFLAPSEGIHVVSHKAENCCVSLSEISLVDAGAFPGTHVEEV